MQIAEHYGAKVVGGGSEKLDAMIELLRPKGLTELVRSGKILMARGLQET